MIISCKIQLSETKPLCEIVNTISIKTVGMCHLLKIIFVYILK